MEFFNESNLRVEMNTDTRLHYCVHELVLVEDDPVSSEFSKWQ